MDEMTQKERRRRLAESFEAALRRARARRQQQAVLSRPPRYDEVFSEGVAWLDRLAETDEWRLEETEAGADR